MKKYRFPLIVVGIIVFAYAVYQYRQPSFSAGEKVPDFSIPLASGTSGNLSDLRGKYVLLQFWGSWCGPCRRENPELVRIYQQFHERGFEIFSIGIENNPTSWQKAIEKDGLIWKYHAMEAGDFSGEIAQLFNIKSIPTLFLLNPEGVIMGVNLSPEYLNRMLKEKLP